MKKPLTLALLFITLAAIAADKYPHFLSLSQHEKENIDYQIVLIDQSSPTTIMAVHGGKIERGTSELLMAMNGDFNKYAFEGLKPHGNFDLHITSSKFDEPKAQGLVSRSKDCLSLHGYIGKTETKPTFCLGGQNQKLAKKMAKALMVLGEDYEVRYPCDAYPGLHENNIVNRCENAGVQIEMNSVLRDRLLEDQYFLSQVAEILSSVMSLN